MGDGALRIGLQRFLEKLLGRAVPERVLVAHGTVETPLRDLIAGGRKMDQAKPLFTCVLGEGRLGAGQPCRRRDDTDCC